MVSSTGSTRGGMVSGTGSTRGGMVSGTGSTRGGWSAVPVVLEDDGQRYR